MQAFMLFRVCNYINHLLFFAANFVSSFGTFIGKLFSRSSANQQAQSDKKFSIYLSPLQVAVIIEHFILIAILFCMCDWPQKQRLCRISVWTRSSLSLLSLLLETVYIYLYICLIVLVRKLWHLIYYSLFMVYFALLTLFGESQFWLSNGQKNWDYICHVKIALDDNLYFS